VRSAITQDQALIDLGVTPEGTLSGDVDTPEQRPFLNLKWGQTLPSFKNQTTITTTLAIWVHDVPADFAKIDAILARLRVLLPAIVGRVNGSSEVQVIEWLNDSPDLQDDGHRTIVKVANFTVVGKF
jgi:hypothetical protein